MVFNTIWEKSYIPMYRILLKTTKLIRKKYIINKIITTTYK